MKRIFTVLFTIFATSLFAQDLQLTVNITDTSGNPSDGIEVLVIDSLGEVFNYGLTDENGNALFEFDNLNPGTQLFIIAANCEGSPLFEVYEYQGEPNEAGLVELICTPFQLPGCGVHIEQTHNQNGVDLLEAAAFGDAPFTYIWNTGDSSAVIQPVDPGVYCVSVTDAAGCMAESCVDYQSIDLDTFCFAWIDVLDNSGQPQLVANGFGIPPYTYEWNNGSNSQSIPFDSSGVYCVTVTDAAGCVTEACLDVFDDECDVSIWEGFQGSLNAFGTGYGHLTYEWNTGETTQHIQGLPGETYCVTVTDVLGCQASACYTVDSIQIDSSCFADIFINISNTGLPVLEAVPFGHAPFQYQWSTGEMSSHIVIQGDGEYCLTLTDANGCVSEQCFEVDLGLDSCGVFLICDPPGTLMAHSFGVGPFTYEWNTGDTVAMIVTNPGQEYCVTVTDANGCVAEACQFVDSTNNPGICPVEITQIPDSTGDGVLLIANGSAGGNTGLFIWSTGDSTNSIYVEQGGEYCVVYVDTTLGCIGFTCTFVDLDQGADFYDIGGLVIGPFNPNQLTGDVLLIAEGANGQLSPVDSFEITSELIDSFGVPVYFFPDVEEGTYYTQFRPDHTAFVPTYHFSSLLWIEADPISIPAASMTTYDIIPQGTQPIMGPGYIGGMVVSGTNFAGGTSRDNDPMQGISVMLMDASGMPVDHAYSDHSGEFGFPNLPWGTYYLTIDHLNVEPKTIEVELAPQNPVLTGMMIEFDGEQFVTDVRQISNTEGFSIFPNPARDLVNVITEGLDGIYNLTIRTVEGRTILSRRIEDGANQIQMDINNLNAGMYLIYLENEKQTYYNKVIKID